MADAPVAIFDGHNDLVGRMFVDPTIDFFSGQGTVHISWDALRAGGMVGGLFALFVPPRDGEGGDTDGSSPGVAPPVPLERARRVVFSQFAALTRLAERSGGRLKVCGSVAEIDACRRDGVVAAIPHLEGAEAISAGLDELDVLYHAGLRSIGPVWSRHNRFARGVPIYGNLDPRDDRGLSSAGRRLVARCHDLGMVVDLSHMTEAGFWDVARIDRGPLVASHSTARVLSDCPRNLSDRQLAAIGDSGGLVGLNFATIFLRSDRAVNADTPLQTMIDHLRHLVDHAGVDHVGLGSDFDGAVIPRDIGTAAGLPRFVEAMRTAGFSAEEIEKICWGNWRRLLQQVWR